MCGFGRLVLTGGMLLTAQRAEALKVPFQESIIGDREKTSTSEQSMAAFDMEGIKKGGISGKARKKILAEVRERALGSANP